MIFSDLMPMLSVASGLSQLIISSSKAAMSAGHELYIGGWLSKIKTLQKHSTNF